VITYRVIVQPGAERDIREAARFIHAESRSAAKALRWVRSLRAKVDTLRTSPERCPVDPDSEAYGREVRVLLFGKRRGVYRILFAIEGDAVQVLTVRHSARRSLREEQESEGETP
jgi:plasmid stabilization system protein ParE